MPVLSVFAGVNGAGKSTLFDYVNSMGRSDFGARVNADEILVEGGGDWRNDNDNLKSGIKAIRKIYSCIQNGESFNWETTIINSFTLKILKLAKEKGYTINYYFVGVESAKLAIERVELREKTGGHGIPKDLILQRYANQYKDIPKAIPYLDRALFFDNSSIFKVVAVYADGKVRFIDDQVTWAKNLQYFLKPEQTTDDTTER